VGKFETLLIEKGIISKEQAEQITENVRNEIRNAITEAQSAPDSDPAELLSSVFRAVN
jgi:TPP-dependent pyruvate/acetoin dehydrogenase alpha subunit